MNSLDYERHSQPPCNVKFQVLLHTLRKKKNPTKITLSIEDLKTNNKANNQTNNQASGVGSTNVITEKTALVQEE